MMKRQTERASAQRREKSGLGAGRRVAEKPPEKTAASVLSGWDLPIIPDDNDIIAWMKREKNGDNKRKKINEVYEEEQYRHVLGHCCAIENKLLFDRQSLNDRYLKNCQFGVRDLRATKVTPVTPLPMTSSARATHTPSQQDQERKCFSANALADETDVINENGEDGENDAEMADDVRVMAPLSRGRSHSAICHSASMRAYGMTLPEADAMAVPGDEVKDEGEDTAWDEGYGSKVSSNDQEHDVVEDESTKTLDDSSGVPEDSASATVIRLGPVLNPNQVQILNHQDAMAKLMYSRRERTVYERLPSRRMRGNSFRYAGREQSRLTEASLSNITPAYLARYHHLADLANTTQGKQPSDAKHNKHGSSEQRPESGGGEGGAYENGVQPRTMVLRKITIQDSGRELFSQHIPDGLNKGSPVLSQPFEKVHRRQGLLSPARTRSERAVSETMSSASGAPQSALSVSEHASVRVQELTPDLALRDSPNTAITVMSASTAATKSVMSMLSVPSARDDAQGSSPAMSPSGTSPSSDKLSSMNNFAVTDLLPAVERNIRNQRSTQRGISKSKNVDVSPGLSNINNRHQHQLQQQRGRQQQQQQYQGVHRPQRGGIDNGATVRTGAGHPSPGREDNRPVPAVSSSAGKNFAAEEVPSGLPGFRPHYHISPLQRAKEIANRRIHGHVTQMPDGSETVRVPSPRYASRTDQQNSNRRAKSASRFPPLLRHRGQSSGGNDVPTTTLSKAHSSMATTLSKSHSSLFTREDMAARLKQL